MTNSYLPLALTMCAPLLALGCGGDDATSFPSSSSGSSTSASSGTGGSGGEGTGGSSTTTSSTTGTGGGGTGGGNPTECDNLAPGPFDPVLVTSSFNGSEDIAFDGKGHIAGKKGAEVVLIDAQDQVTSLGPLAGTVYGLRYGTNGDLYAAMPQTGKLIAIAPDGTATDYIEGLGTPNGLYPDLDGNLWVTEFGANAVTLITAPKDVSQVVSGERAGAANRVGLAATPNRVYFTEYQEGRIRRLDLNTPGSTADEVVKISGAALDGLVLDVCGNIYAIDQGNSRMYRVRVDEAGVATAEPELLADFPKNVANAQFGAGPGFDAKTLYAAGTPGSVYAVPVGVAGAPVVLPP